ncbi:uncharacterized protein LOC135685671 [Rhopilema esculentum]|uniref:uncharacterized protein LOC135685671 n=1 Tax=Rhopilema esculentum TaxID=499914 RepID=UPI0031DEA9AD
MKKISLAYYKPLVYILIFLLQFPLFRCMIADEQEQCHECFREAICDAKTSSFLIEAIDIGLVNGTDSWLMEKFGAENIVQDLSMPPCIRNRMRGIVAFVFGRQKAPQEISGCDDSTDCNNPNCSKYLTVANNTWGNDGKIEPRKLKLLSMLGKAIFFGNNSHGNASLQTDEDKDFPDLPPKAHVSCPTQKHYPIIERVNILLYTARNLFNCTLEEAGTFTSPQLTPQNISHDAFMDKVMLMKMNVFSNLLAITDRLGMSKSTLEHKVYKTHF